MSKTIKLNSLIDHTLLKEEAQLDEIIKVTKEAKEYGFHSVCVRPEWVKEVASQYRCSAVIAFPDDFIQCNSERDLVKAMEIIGEEDFDIKMLEFRKAIEAGALELDPVMPVAKLEIEDIQEQDKLKEELDEYFRIAREYEIKDSEKLLAKNKAINPDDDFTLFIKPIFSCECLNDEELELSVSIFAEAVLEFKTENPESKIRFAYKNSTGFIKGLDDIKQEAGDKDAHPQACQATPELISKIATHLNFFDPEKSISIKAAGGIKDKASAEKIIEAAGGRLSHLGTSNSIKLSNP